MKIVWPSSNISFLTTSNNCSTLTFLFPLDSLHPLGGNTFNERNARCPFHLPLPPIERNISIFMNLWKTHFEIQDNDTLKTSNVISNEDETNWSRVDLTLALGRMIKGLKVRSLELSGRYGIGFKRN
jgi:hypothetical protein